MLKFGVFLVFDVVNAVLGCFCVAKVVQNDAIFCQKKPRITRISRIEDEILLVADDLLLFTGPGLFFLFTFSFKNTSYDLSTIVFT